MQNEAATLLDVARAAKVSKTTVSNVFSFPERVRPALRERVEAAARELGYAGPDPKGRLLSSGKVNAIGIVPPADGGYSWVFHNSYMAPLLAGVAEVCEAHGVALTLLIAKDASGAWQMQNAVVDGIILGTPEQLEFVKPFMGRKIPMVVLDADAGPEVNSVRVDGRRAVRDLTEHLLELGHRRFLVCSVARGFVAPIVHPPTGRPRQLQSAYSTDLDVVAGVADALEPAGLSIDDMTIVECCGSAAEKQRFGITSAEAIADNLGDATAVIILNNDVTTPLYAELGRRNIAIPRDVSIVGTEDRPEFAAADPPVTLMTEVIAEKGRRAAELLFAGGPPQQIVLPIEMKLRASTAPPRDTAPAALRPKARRSPTARSSRPLGHSA